MKYRVNLDEISSTIFQSDIVDRIIEAVWAVWAMEHQQIRAALDQHLAASAAGDLEKEHEIYDDDVVVNYPQSKERILGRRNIQALRGHHPSKPAGFMIMRIFGNGDLWITEYVIVY